MSESCSANAINTNDRTFVAGETLTSDQYKLMIVHTDGTVKKATAATSMKVAGVLQNAPASAAVATVRTARGASSKVIAGAAVTMGDRIVSDSGGCGITATTGTLHVCGIALTSASTSEQFEMLIVDDYIG